MPTVVEELIIQLGYDVDLTPLTKAQRDAIEKAQKIETAHKEAAKKAGEAWKRFAQNLRSGINKAGKALAGLAAGGIAAGLALTKRFADSARETEQLAIQLGATTTEVQRLAGAAKIAGVDHDNLVEGVKTLQENLGELERLGTGPAVDSLMSLGLTIEDFVNKPVEKRMEIFADAIAGVEDPSKRLSIAMEVMGTDGAKLLPILSDGSQGLRALMQSAEDAGIVLDEKTIASAADLDQKMRDVTATVEGASNKIMIALLPSVTEAAEGFAGWVDTNQDMINQRIPETIDAIASAFRAVGDAIGFASRAADRFADYLLDDTFERMAFLMGHDPDALKGGARRGTTHLASPEVAAKARARQAQARREAEQRLASDVEYLARDAERMAAENAPYRKSQALKRQQEAEAASARRRKAARAEARARRAAAGRGGGGRSRAASLDLLEGTGIGEEIMALASRDNATDQAIAAAKQAAAEAIKRGVNSSVARKAGLSSLSSYTGADYSTTASRDPLSKLLGASALPDASPADITGGKAPQVLSAVINNSFTIEQNYNIDGAGDPQTVAGNVAATVRSLFQDELQKTSRFVKVQFSR